MSVALAVPRTGFKFVLAVREGPDKGATFQLLPPRVSIGRGPDNDVQLKDPRVSRQAAVIEMSMEKITLTDMSGRMAVKVNGTASKQTLLRDGDRITMGDTDFQFVVEALPLSGPGPAGLGPVPSGIPGLPPMPRPGMPGAPAGFGMPPGSAGGTTIAAAPPPPPPEPAPIPIATPASMPGPASKRVRFYIIIAIALGGLGWLLSSEDVMKPKEKGIRTVEEIEKELEVSQKNRDEIVKRREFASPEERTRFEEAQRHYLEGFRDYQKGQWVRALRSFETARAIDPGHEMAGRYLRLAEKQRDELIALLTLEGRRYKEKSMYARCSAAFEKVLDAIPSKNDVKYKAAEALKTECDLLIDEKFR